MGWWELSGLCWAHLTPDNSESILRTTPDSLFHSHSWADKRSWPGPKYLFIFFYVYIYILDHKKKFANLSNTIKSIYWNALAMKSRFMYFVHSFTPPCKKIWWVWIGSEDYLIQMYLEGNGGRQEGLGKVCLATFPGLVLCSFMKV